LTEFVVATDDRPLSERQDYPGNVRNGEDEAIGWVKECPNPMLGPSEIEIRPLYEMEDFA
jgi:hypothetical protein